MYNEREYWNNRIKNVGTINTSPINIDTVNRQEYNLLIKYIKKNDIILDYGVGGGRLFPTYNFIKPIVQGWDIADFRDLLNLQKEKYPDFIFHHYYSEINNIWDMIYPDDNFKVIVSFSVFTHIKPENIKKTISELMRIGEVVIISGYDAEPLEVNENSYCFLHDYKKLLEPYKIIETFKINKISYFVIQK